MNFINFRCNTAMLIFGYFCLLSNLTYATDYFVDQGTLGNDNNLGTSLNQPWRTITKANQTLVAGDTVYIKAGTYNTYIAPQNSGSLTHLIKYRNYASEMVTISDASYGIYLNGKSYISIEGINFSNLDRFMYLLNNANSNIIAYCNFDKARLVDGKTATWSGSKIYRSSKYNWIHHCRFSQYGYYDSDDHGSILDIGNEESTTDITSHNLIENSIFYHGGHHILGVFGMYNVIRNNYFHNEPWAMGTSSSDRGAIMYGNRNVIFSGYPNNSGFNLFEGNQVAYSSDPPDNIGASGTSLTTAYNIVRFNYFYHNNRAGLSMSLTSTYYSDIVFNKIYNNTLFHNGINTEDPIDHMNSGIGFGLYSGIHIIKDNAIKNNLLYSHRVAYGAYRVDLGDQIFANNWDGDTQGDPKFVNASETLGDAMNSGLPSLDLQPDSPCIDQGGYLTTITSASGSGTSFTVEDAGYFMDGWGIKYVQGDEIQLHGTTQKARVVSINYITNMIAVDQVLSWQQGQGISNSYKGKAPDIGAFESEGTHPQTSASAVWYLLLLN